MVLSLLWVYVISVVWREYESVRCGFIFKCLNQFRHSSVNIPYTIQRLNLWPILLICFNFNPSMDNYLQNRNRTSTHGARASPVRRRTNFAPRTGTALFKCMHYRLTCPYGFIHRKRPVNSPYWDRKGSVRAPTATYDARAGFLQILVVSIPIRVRKSAIRHPCGYRMGPYGSCRIWKTLEIPVLSPCDARTGIAQGPCGILRIIRSHHKCAAVSSRTGPDAWCDHGNSTGVKFLLELHSDLWARNRVGAKLVWGPWLDVTKPLPGTHLLYHSLTHLHIQCQAFADSISFIH